MQHTALYTMAAPGPRSPRGYRGRFGCSFGVLSTAINLVGLKRQVLCFARHVFQMQRLLWTLKQNTSYEGWSNDCCDTLIPLPTDHRKKTPSTSHKASALLTVTYLFKSVSFTPHIKHRLSSDLLYVYVYVCLSRDQVAFVDSSKDELSILAATAGEEIEHDVPGWRERLRLHRLELTVSVCTCRRSSCVLLLDLFVLLVVFLPLESCVRLLVSRECPLDTDPFWDPQAPLRAPRTR